MINDMPEEIYALSGRSDSFDGVYDTYQWPDQSGTKYIRADKAIPEGYALVPISPNEKAFAILWYITNFNSIDECCTFYETLITAAQEENDE